MIILFIYINLIIIKIRKIILLIIRSFYFESTRFSNKYEYIQDISSINISFAQDLYDINIAIISFDNEKIELFYESKNIVIVIRI